MEWNKDSIKEENLQCESYDKANLGHGPPNLFLGRSN
jgi:hypothetical protein